MASLLAAPLDTNASLLIGNLTDGSSGALIATEAGNTFGSATEFTPSQNLAFDSTTLWISGYNGLDGSVLSLSLMADNSAYGLPFSGPAATIASATAAANDGSDAAFDFNLGGQLKANTPYWLFLYLEVPNGGFGENYGQYNCFWDGGGNPIGNVTINGSEVFADGFNPASFHSDAPAFALNSVPEQTSTALLLGLGLGGCALVRHHQLRRQR